MIPRTAALTSAELGLNPLTCQNLVHLLQAGFCSPERREPAATPDCCRVEDEERRCEIRQVSSARAVPKRERLGILEQLFEQRQRRLEEPVVQLLDSRLGKAAPNAERKL